ncbi:MAG TPA: M56 family metallopeptidase [Bryobacteraceae bacterium]|nr:M56 family metallopeptidase [Bryobacteraceae bacterium]
MTAGLWWRDLLAWSLQVLVLAGVGTLVAQAARLHDVRARQYYWQALLLLALALPAVEPWRQVAGTVTVEMGPAQTKPADQETAARWRIPWLEAALCLLAAGAATRGAWLAGGFVRLARYRRESPLVEPLPAGLDVLQRRLMVWAEFRRCDEVAGPVTFGWRRPVVLLPGRLLEMAPAQLEAVACHELIHVRRRDWAVTVVEELVRAVLWFHPAIWWILSQIQLAREQAVDHETIRWTAAREQYLDALLAVAGGPAEADLAPAPLFLRKHHLRARVVSIVKEVSMSKERVATTLAASLLLLLGTAWFAAGVFPLEAAPQEDAQGISVDVGSVAILHRTGVEYPREAREKGIQGDVLVGAQINERGLVMDARVLSGPEELRAAALASVLQWHFAKPASAPVTAQVTIHFQLAGAAAQSAAGTAGPSMTIQPAPLKQLTVEGLPPARRDELLIRLPVHEGDMLNTENVQATVQAVREFDEHLSVNIQRSSDGASMRIVLSPTVGVGASRNTPTIRVGTGVQQNKLRSQVPPVYPPEAKQARIQGTVRMNATIGEDGKVQNLTVVNGHPLLVPAAMEAVRQWVYAPTLLNGNPVAVMTTVEVNFTLN